MSDLPDEGKGWSVYSVYSEQYGCEILAKSLILERKQKCSQGVHSNLFDIQ